MVYKLTLDIKWCNLTTSSLVPRPFYEAIAIYGTSESGRIRRAAKLWRWLHSTNDTSHNNMHMIPN